MTSPAKHHKHPPLPKPALGEWGRNEVAILGAPCDEIRMLAKSIADGIRENSSVCYIDADHSEDTQGVNAIKPFHAVCTDKIGFRRIDMLDNPSLFDRRAQLSQYDIILINGNHFTAKEQIVILHSKKIASLERKTDRLTHVSTVLEMDVPLSTCAFLHPFLNSNTRIFAAHERDTFVQWLRTRFPVPAVNGLVLAGGHSIRMGTDKSLIPYHGMTQRDYCMQLLEQENLAAFLSCRQDQVAELSQQYRILPDRFTGFGPYGAILTAMMSAPDSAWLVIASDLPFVTRESIHQLLQSRNPTKCATAYLNPATGFPEPLIALWEPKAYPVLLQFLAQGNICPRKVLINSDIHLINAADPEWLLNVNTPEELERVRTRFV